MQDSSPCEGAAYLHGNIHAIFLEAPFIDDLAGLNVCIEQFLSMERRQHVHSALPVHQQHLVGRESSPFGRSDIEADTSILQNETFSSVSGPTSSHPN